MNQQVTKKEQVNSVRNLLEQMRPQMNAALPKHLTSERLARVAMTTIQNTPKLLDCDRSSLISAIMSCAQLGLEPDGLLGQAYLIPFKNKVQFIPGYKGLIDLARRSGDVSSILAKEVYENDEFSVDYSQEPPFVHKPCLKGERGEAILFWCLAKFKDGGYHWDYMTVEEINAVRDGSSGYQSAKRFAKGGVINSPWVSHYNEMAKKTVVRRICKMLPMSVARAAMIEDAVDAGKRVDRTETGDFIVVDHEPTPAQDDDGGNQTAASSKLEAFVDNETGEVIEGNVDEERRQVESGVAFDPEDAVDAKVAS